MTSINIDQEATLLGQLLLWLWEHYPKPWEERYGSQRAQRISASLISRVLTFGDTVALERVIPSATRRRSDLEGYSLFLQPVEAGTRTLVPILSLKCDFDRSPIPETRFYLRLFYATDGSQNQSICDLGLRFETPEGVQEGAGDGVHDFYHSQLVCSRTKSPDGSPALWLPDVQPSFPVDARTPVQLFLCSLISVYGLRILDELAVANKQLGGMLVQHMAGLSAWRDRPTYWRVDRPSGPKYFKVWGNLPSLRIRYSGSGVARIDAGEYRDQDATSRFDWP